MNSRKSFYDIASFYKQKAVLSASFKGMRYRVEKAEDVLSATVWPEPFCFERTPEEKKENKQFSFTEEGLDEAYRWICAQYDERKEEWEAAGKNRG